MLEVSVSKHSFVENWAKNHITFALSSDVTVAKINNINVELIVNYFRQLRCDFIQTSADFEMPLLTIKAAYIYYLDNDEAFLAATATRSACNITNLRLSPYG